MNLYPVVVFTHVASILLFFIAHGVSMAVAFRIKRETDPARVRALLELSSWTVGWPMSVPIVVGFFTGIAAGIMGGWFGQLWIWVSLVLFIAVTLAMTPLAAMRLGPIRTAAGVPPKVKKGEPWLEGTVDPAEMSRLITAWQPWPIAVLGLGTFLVILWLMLYKPF